MAYRILRTILVILLALPLAVPLILYVLLSLPAVQRYAGARAERELTALLGTPVSIGEVDYAPFNRVRLRDVSVIDLRGDTALAIGHLGAGVSIIESLWQRRPIVTYAELIDLDLRLTRDSVGAPLNIAPILERFRSTEKKEPSLFDLSVNMVVIRRSALSLDVLNQPAPVDGRFDPSHIRVSDLRADLRAPRIKNDRLDVEIRRLAAKERSGLTITSLSAALGLDSAKATVNNLALALPASKLLFDRLDLDSPLAKGFNPKNIATRVATLPGSYVTPADISPFVPALASFTTPIDIALDASGSMADISLSRLELSLRGKSTWVEAEGVLKGMGGEPEQLAVDIDRLSVNVNLPAALAILADPGMPGREQAAGLAPLAPLGSVNLLGSLAATANSADFNGSLLTDCGNLDLDCGISRADRQAPLLVDGTVAMEGFDPSALLPALATLTDVTLAARADLRIGPDGFIDGLAECNIASLSWKGNTFSSIEAAADFTGSHVDISLASHSPGLTFTASGGHDLKGPERATECFADIATLDLSHFVPSGSSLAGASVRGTADISLHGTNPDDITGWVRLGSLLLERADGRRLDIPSAEIEASRTDSTRLIALHSPMADMELSGSYTFRTLAETLETTAAQVLPALFPKAAHKPLSPDVAANLDITLHPDTTLSRFFKLPVEVIYPVTLSARADGSHGTASMRLDAPYLRNKDKLVENTSLRLSLDGNASRSLIEGATTMPTKNGPMRLTLNSIGHADSIRTGVFWKIDRQADFHGQVVFSTLLDRDEAGRLDTRIKFHPSKLVFNDSAWAVAPGTVDIRPGIIAASGVGASRRGQRLDISGSASADSTENLIVTLDQIDLDYLFETLAISDAVTFGGRATGKLFARQLLSPAPVLYTPRLYVEGLSYNHCVMGNGDIRSWWDNAAKSIIIKADIKQSNGEYSLVAGHIKPLTEELDFRFSANDTPVEFMLPFMSAFTSQVTGTVSGNAHLAGTFKDLDINGDIFVNNLGMKLDFTNTTYHVTDSVHLRPGLITFNDVVLTDDKGKSAKLTGRVGHTYFHDPTFKFEISDARNLLVYDIGKNDTEDPWYGRIYGRGNATVTGVPGFINIDVDMTTERGSTFTLVLDDRENSAEYDFITFRDRDRATKDSVEHIADSTPQIVRQLRDRIKRQEQGPPSVYRLEFNVDVTPAATLNIIMDPAGGDKITANGAGHLNMIYDSSGDLELYGKYILNRGTYNFTLQDIVIKDFIIREGSSIEFRGDPYSAQLDITAAYTTNANLSDLDESFIDDPELTRTNIPVTSLLMARGDMRQPEIKFDLEFPTLTTGDVYRKVRSIISTDEMMDRQIMYLLALNRFYTPDYMTATRGNELVSVASSTISSRLGSMLGQLSDNWSIAPSVRSDRGDFSDVEVDLALSSHLLDNRLLLNGNLGYRDKSLNNNTFIGDFDIRYLLNRAGTLQLKAYNRYNDQNYYLKTALTTQGIGIVFKRDFDTFRDFFHRPRYTTTF